MAIIHETVHAFVPEPHCQFSVVTTWLVGWFCGNSFRVSARCDSYEVAVNKICQCQSDYPDRQYHLYEFRSELFLKMS